MAFKDIVSFEMVRGAFDDGWAANIKDCYRAEYLPKLVIGNFRANRLTSVGASALIKSFQTSACEALLLERNAIEPDAYEELQALWVASGKPDTHGDLLTGLYL